METEKPKTGTGDWYPPELEAEENELVAQSRTGRQRTPPSGIGDCIGVGVSGGGIRSATFSLGVFQGLAHLGLLPLIDFISTVSGGGYFGSFYTRMFLREKIDMRFVEQTLKPCQPMKPASPTSVQQRGILNWLRENGRYLAPRGSGDLLLAGAVLFRNWIVVQIVLALLFLLFFLSAQLVRIPLDSWFFDLAFLKEPRSELVLTLPGQLKLWMSPFILLPCALFVFGAVPPGWAYWLVGHQPPDEPFWKNPVTGLFFVAAVAAAALFLMPHSLAPPALLAVCILTGIWCASDNIRSNRSREADTGPHQEQFRRAYQDDLARNLVSAQLKHALILTAVTLAFVAVDSLGQTVYLLLLTPGSLRTWAGGLVAAIVAVVPFATRIMIPFKGANGKKPPAVITKIAAAVAAFVVITTILVTVDVAANAIAWNGQKPVNSPEGFVKKAAATLATAPIVPNRDEPNNWSVISDDQENVRPQIGVERDTMLLAGMWFISLCLSFLFGHSWPFLNRSTQLPFYSSRLIRAYLGASNPRRHNTGECAAEKEGGAITRVIPGDDIDVEYYWQWPRETPKTQGGEATAEKRREEGSQRGEEKPLSCFFGKGMPLHLVNVTINETVDGKSQVQQQDRKGTGMALGPAGISAGIRHHVVFAANGVRTYPERGFRVFNYGGPETDRDFKGERLSLGSWLSISGAAFSTGVGARTSLPLSLLTGVGNVRLGYWWNSGIVLDKREAREKPTLAQRVEEELTALFPVQAYLLNEYTARFHGTARRHWYLTDGGHFENMGGYELIRRRLRLMIIIDSEADPDYTFGGLGGLIRKARIDFRAEITFLDDDELDQVLPEGHCFSTLENLRRGKWVEERLPLAKKRRRKSIDPVDHRCFSLAHAAIARVCYDCKETPESCLIYIKPTLLGNEPLDVLQYHVENETFPQQTTMDQFFDEAQWESYRALGEHVAREVFKAPEGENVVQWLESLADSVLRGKEVSSLKGVV